MTNLSSRLFLFFLGWNLLAIQNNVQAGTLPSPILDPLECRSDNTTRRICDPDAILTYKGRQAVQQEINVFETYNVTCKGEQVPVQMGIALIRSMKLPLATDSAIAAGQKATEIHNAWGVGYQSKCGGTGILLFLSIDDHQIFMSRGKALATILSDDRLTYVVDKMKPHLRDGRHVQAEYKEGLTLGVQLLTAYVSGDRPGFDETMDAVTSLLGILGIFGACIGCMACIDWCHRRRDRRLREELRDDLSRLDRDRALALQGQYKSTSCPICLEDFDMDNNQAGKNGESKALLPVRDGSGEPLKLLKCGHIYHQSCWDDFSTHPSTGQSTEGGLKCPICREPVVDQTGPPTPRGPLDDAAYEEERRFRLDRLREMYPTFIGTQYIDQWYDPDYRGSLLEDYVTMEAEQRALAEQAEAERNRMFSYESEDSADDFGGGKADGGGVGDSF